MRVFSAKLGMALFREHTGNPLPEGGLVFSQHYFNAGLYRDEVSAALGILPAFSQLQQGTKVSGKIFNYRYNTDKRSIVAAFIAINNNLFVRLFAISDMVYRSSLEDIHRYDPIKLGELAAVSAQWQKS